MRFPSAEPSVNRFNLFGKINLSDNRRFRHVDLSLAAF